MKRSKQTARQWYAVSHPLHGVILSIWRSTRDREAWLAPDSRRRAMQEIAAMLREPEGVAALEPV